MNTDFDSLERELQGLQPREPSPDLTQRLASKLDSLESPSSFRIAWRATITVVAAAAAIVAFVVLFRPTRNSPPAVPNGELIASETKYLPLLPPRLGDYQTAFAESPEALDRLLAQHSRMFGGSETTSSYVTLNDDSTGVP